VSLWRQLTHGLRAIAGGRSADREVDEELQHFIDESARELEAGGMTPQESQREARRRLGCALTMREDVRASGWEHVVETLAADLRHGWRRLRRAPGFAAVTIATLGLGIGSATAMLSIAGPILVQMLPFPNADGILAIWDQAEAGERAELTFGSFLEVQSRSRAFDAMAVSRIWQPTLTGGSTPERLEGQGVTADYFRVFGVAPRVGRSFDVSDDVPNAPRVVMLSDRIWRRRFNADPAIVGRQVTLDGVSYDVIGVMPPSFDHRLMPPADLWRALQYDRTLPSLLGREWGHHLRMVARLRQSLPRQAAIAELDQIARDRVPHFTRPPWAQMPNGLIVESLHEGLTRAARPAMRAVLAAASLLLLTACVNVVNLLLGRDAERRAELAMRAALGAGRVRLVRQLLTETLMMAALGGLAGVLVAQAFVRALTMLGPEGVLHATGAALDAPVFAVAFAVTAIVGVGVGLTPAFSSSYLTGSIPQGSWQSAESHRLTRRLLVVAEVAFALVVLVGAGLLFQSLRQLLAIAPGFDSGHVLAMQVQVAGPRFADAATTKRFFEEALEAVKRVPGVEGAALTTQLPLSGDSDVWGLQFESSGAQPGNAGGGAFRYAVSPGYFETMRIPLLRGRLLSDQDHATAPFAALISQSTARARFGDSDPLGQRLHAGPTDRPWFTVVGVVADVKQLSLETDWFDAVYVAPAQWHFADRAMWLVIRSRGDAAALTPAIRSAVWSVDKDQPIVRVATLDAMVASTARVRSFALLLFEAFGLAALLLTAVGIYGVVSSGVTARRREIGIRTALGASRSNILGGVIGEGVRLSAAGIAIGLTAAALSSRGLSTLLFGVSPLDPLSYGVVAIVLLGVTIAACWLPARRAAGVDPATTLRAE
jgi:putative ABC transport system permease protein